ncbi:MAG: M56 family metallopeptidase, partial [Pirellulales bacterium]
MNQLVTSLNQAAESWWSFVVHASWQAAAVGLGVLIVLRFGRRWPAPLRYGLVLIALIKFASPPMIGAPVGQFSRFVSSNEEDNLAASELPAANSSMIVAPPATMEPADVDAITAGPIAASAPVETDATAVAPPFTAVSERARDVLEKQYEIAEAGTADAAALPVHLRGRAWLMLLHLSGAALLAGWTAWQLWLLRGLVSRSRPITAGPYHEQLLALARQLKTWRTPRLLESPEAVSPMAVGTWRPTVVIPARVLASSSAGDLQTVLAHELAHLRRGDVWINWLRIVLVTAWWFHPVVWLVSRALRRVHEDCCDDLLLVDGLTRDDEYCQTLLRVASQISSGASAGMALGMAHRPHPLGDRLLRIMDRAVRRRSRLSLGGACLLALLAAFLLPGLDRRPAQAAPGNSQEVPATVGAKEPQAETKAVAQARKTFAGNTETEDSAAAIAGIVVDANEKPVAGVTVWLLGGDWRDDLLQHRAETITDEKGRFGFTQFREDELFKPTQGQVLPTVMVRDERRRLGWVADLRAPAAKHVNIR